MTDFLAVFTGSMTSPAMQAWIALPEAERKARERDGFAGWQAWIAKHHDDIAYMGGPLGKTKSVSKDGVADITNALSGFLVVRADSHDAAARLFENHPQFAIFPGEGVEVMAVLPIPG